MESIGELMVKLKGDVGGWQEGLFHWACSLAESTAKDLFDKIDQELMPSANKGPLVLFSHCVIEHARMIRIQTGGVRYGSNYHR